MVEDVTIVIVVGVVFAAASVVHGVAGFGFSLLAVGILSAVIGPKIAVPLNAVAASVNCMYLAWLLRRSGLFKQAVTIILVAGVFVPVGAVFLSRMDRTIVVRALGVLVLTVPLISLFGVEKSAMFASRPGKWLGAAGCGLFGGAFNIPGPPIVLYAYNCGWPVRDAMATLQFIFSGVAVFTLSAFWWTGLLTSRIAVWGLAYVPLVLAFTLLGARLSKRLAVGQVRAVINVALVVLGIALIVRG